MSTQVTVTTLPPCDICNDGTPARYDGRTVHGSWAYLCERHWRSFGVGTLGTGYGQRLVTADEKPRRRRSAPAVPKSLKQREVLFAAQSGDVRLLKGRTPQVRSLVKNHYVDPDTGRTTAKGDAAIEHLARPIEWSKCPLHSHPVGTRNHYGHLRSNLVAQASGDGETVYVTTHSASGTTPAWAVRRSTIPSKTIRLLGLDQPAWSPRIVR